MKHLRLCLAALLLGLPLAPSAHAAVILVLKLDGIDGESTIIGHEKEIVVTSVSFSIEQATMIGKDASATGGAGAGSAMFAPLVITKNSDRSSPLLFLRSALGSSIKSAKLSFLMPNGSGQPVEFFSIRLSGVFLSKYAVATSNGDEANQEEISINYKALLLTYTPPLGGAPIVAGFDLKTNRSITTLD
jgi:type VI secretion system Hcp family effector